MRAELLALAVLLAACAQTRAPEGPSAGHFTFAKPTVGTEGKRAVRWAYGFQFTVDPKSVTGVNLSCGDIQGTGVSVAAEELNADSSGAAIWYGPEYLLNRDSVPWLFISATTTAICQAVVSRDGFDASTARLPVTFTGAVKREMVDNLERAADDQRARKRDESPDD